MSKLGTLGWSANGVREFLDEVAPVLMRGAVLTGLQVERDRGIVHYEITVERDQALEVLGYLPQEDEWLDMVEDALPWRERLVSGQTLGEQVMPAGDSGAGREVDYLLQLLSTVAKLARESQTDTLHRAPVPKG